MTLANIQDLLPDPSRDTYERLKKEHPYNILSKYARAISDKYPRKLEGVITESSDVTNKNFVGYTFYIMAAIGRGYSYRLMEAMPATADMYPLKVTLFESYPHELPLADGYVEFENTLYTIVRSGFTQTLLLNLVAQVDLYNETRSEYIA